MTKVQSDTHRKKLLVHVVFDDDGQTEQNAARFELLSVMEPAIVLFAS